MKILTVLLTATSLMFVSPLAQAADAKKTLSGPIKVDGSSTVYPVTEAVAEEFQREHPDTRVTVGVSGTGGGMKRFTVGETDISNASRAIKDSESKKAADNKIEYIELMVAYDGLSVVVAKDSPLSKITSAELKKLWQPGSKVQKWSDLRKDLPAQAVKLYGPGPDSGTFDYFTEEIMGEEDKSRSDYTASEDDNALVTGIVSDKHAMGYFGFSYFITNQNKLKALEIDGIAPTMETIKSGSYPLARPLFIYVSNKAAQKKQVDAFVNFYLENAAELAKQVGYTPLSKKEYKDQISKYKTFASKHAKDSKKAH